MSLMYITASAKQFIPARGRKLRLYRTEPPAGFETIHPRKGTETATRYNMRQGGEGNNSSPQGDGNPDAIINTIHYDVKQFIPARGRKRPARAGRERQGGRNNSSPQGDGNGAIVVLTTDDDVKQFIPARGRKLRNGNAACPITDIETIHPRKGTETESISSLQRASPKQFIPARGRKPSARLCPCTRKRNNSSPQGDGNSYWPPMTMYLLVKQFIPARGRKHDRVPAPCTGRMRNNSSPQGDGNDRI